MPASNVVIHPLKGNPQAPLGTVEAHRRRRGMIAGIVSGGGAAIVGVYRSGAWTLGIALLVVALFAGIAYPSDRRFRRTASLHVDDEQLERIGPFTGRTIVSRSDIERLQRVPIRFYARWAASAPPTPYLLVLGAGGKCHMRLLARAWGDSGIAQLQTALDVPIAGSWTEDLKVKEAARRYPGVLPWWLVHIQALVMWSAVVVVFGASVVYIAVTGAH